MKLRASNYLTPELGLALLNRLLGMLDCSLARYLSYARPWARRPYMLLDALARRLSHEHESFAASIARLIVARRGTISQRQFPMDFTYYNDLSLEYLAPRLMEHQRLLIDESEDCAEKLVHDLEANRLLKKLVESLCKHAALLEELLAPRLLSAPHPEEDGDTPLHRAEIPPTLSKGADRTSDESRTAA